MSRWRPLREIHADDVSKVPADFADVFEAHGGLFLAAGMVPRLIARGFDDDEIFDEITIQYERQYKQRMGLRQRRALEAYVSILRTGRPRVRRDAPKEYARIKIVEIRREYAAMRRRTGRPPSKSAMAIRVGIHRDTRSMLGSPRATSRGRRLPTEN